MTNAQHPLPFGHARRADWLLEPGMVFLNHGSFGATPRDVLAEQERWRLQLERQPVRFFMRELDPALQAARGQVATFLGGREADFAFVENATNGINAVLRSLRLRPEERILTTSHTYNAVRNAVRWVCERAGAESVEVHVPFPVEDPRAFVDALVPELDRGCRLLLVDHLCSASGLVVPLELLLPQARARGVPVLVDGAHGPGMLPVDLAALGSAGATWYVGNLHKWVCAPKGSGFLWTSTAGRSVQPVVTSHRMGEEFPREFDYFGTRDPSGWLAAPAAVERLVRLDPGRVRAWNHHQATQGASILTGRWGGSLPGPTNAFGSIVPVAAPARFAATAEAALALHDHLWDQHRVEVPVYPFQGRLWVRVSGQIYNEESDYCRLRDAVAAS